MTHGNKFRSKGKNELFDDRWSSINAFKAKENICGLMVTSYNRSFFFREKEKGLGKITLFFLSMMKYFLK